jgi:hypothetical protein
MENKQVSQTLLDYLLERITHALVPLVYVRAYAMRESLKESSLP